MPEEMTRFLLDYHRQRQVAEGNAAEEAELEDTGWCCISKLHKGL